MLGQALVFLRAAVNAQLELADSSRAEPAGDPVVFLDGTQLDPPQFARNAITLLLVNVEEQRLLRAKSRPPGEELQLNLHVLFVARFGDYARAWDRLSEVIAYFQEHRVITDRTAPGMPEGINQLIVELVTSDLAALNELWGSLRMAQHPALLYRVGVVALRPELMSSAGPVEEIAVGLRGDHRR